MSKQAQQTRPRCLPEQIIPGQAITALAPMQDVTDLPFMKVVADCGAPDYFFTEFFRVHEHSRLEKHILASITENDTGRPVFAQMIGEDIDHLKRTVALLKHHPIAGIDLNMGCPAPRVYKKNVGGGLLRDPNKIDEILGSLRESTEGLFTVKMRIGFEDTRYFDTILGLIEKHQIDLLSIHGRTVKGMYRSEVDYDAIMHAVDSVPCPVLANGDVSSARKAQEILDHTRAAGVMIGRHAIRNPWIFRQYRELASGQESTRVRLSEVSAYVKNLYAAIHDPKRDDRSQTNKMKKYLNFVGQGVDPEGRFLHDMRRTQSKEQLFEVCDRHLLETENEFFADEPYTGVVARPSCE